MKKLFSLLLAVAMLLSLAACGGSGDNGAASGDGEYKVAMLSDFSGINDKSFNQTTWEACSAFGEANGMEIRYYLPTSSDDAGRIAAAELAIADGYNVIVMPGYAFAATVVELANNYPGVKIVALDVSVGDLLEKAVAAKGEVYDFNPANWDLSAYVDMTDVYCAVYQEELCGYMAGYAAVKLGYTKLGYLGGMAVPAVQRYGYGYVQGADAAAAELGIEIEMNYVYGGIFYGDADITAVMDTWYANGTQIVFACGGSIWSSAAESAKKYGAKIIGVDTDQAAEIDEAYGEGITVTSAMKGLGPTTINMLTEIIVNNNWAKYAGKVETLGLISEDPAANYVQLAPSTLFGEGFSAEDYAALVKAMLEGTVTVSNDTTVMPATTNTKLNDQGSIK